MNDENSEENNDCKKKSELNIETSFKDFLDVWKNMSNKWKFKRKFEVFFMMKMIETMSIRGTKNC